MNVSDVSCDAVVALMGRWRDGTLAERDRAAYEEHVLICPPCGVRHDCTRRALDALADAVYAHQA